MLILYKNIGQTPLEVIELYKKDHPEVKDAPMTYAGRLDPMAEGVLVILVGDECKEKDKYINLDKEYEVEVLLGIKTDTGDTLGVVSEVNLGSVDLNKIILNKYIGKFVQDYPAYSSKTINGIQLHTLAREGKLPDEMPKKEVNIYSIDISGHGMRTGQEISDYSIFNINKVKGDFRQKDIIEKWKLFGLQYGGRDFLILKIKVSCSSGTYMRILAQKIAEDIGTVGVALSIKRTRVGDYF